VSAVEVVADEDLSDGRRRAIRSLLLDAFEDFTEDDWAHTGGGLRVMVSAPELVAHAAIIGRTLGVGTRLVTAGYVEGVATAPARQGEGLGSLVMERVTDVLRERFEMGALATGSHAFYERLGWQRWRGLTFVRDGCGLVRTPDDDDAVMVLLYGRSDSVDLTEAISCEPRPGNDW
jgi:aminoglycoside 2'-N-acetyltransferase I